MDSIYFYLAMSVFGLFFLIRTLGKLVFTGILTVGVWWLYTWYQNN